MGYIFDSIVDGLFEGVALGNEMYVLKSQIDEIDEEISSLRGEFMGSIVNRAQLERLRKKRMELSDKLAKLKITGQSDSY